MEHGGKRRGAGRPKTKGAILQIHVSPVQKAWIVKAAAKADMTLTDFVISQLQKAGLPVNLKLD